MEPLKIVHISTMNCPDDAGYETPCWVCGHPYDWGACHLPRRCPRCGADPVSNSLAGVEAFLLPHTIARAAFVRLWLHGLRHLHGTVSLHSYPTCTL